MLRGQVPVLLSHTDKDLRILFFDRLTNTDKFQIYIYTHTHKKMCAVDVCNNDFGTQFGEW